MKKSYEELLIEYILDPLQLNDTSVSRLRSKWNTSGLVPLNQSWMSPGHDKYTGKVRVRRQPYGESSTPCGEVFINIVTRVIGLLSVLTRCFAGVFKANGALKSTAGDMMRWLQV